MTADSPEHRRPPRERFAGTEHVFDLAETAANLRAEGTPARDGHRQVAIFHQGALRLIVFDFEAGGRLPGHKAEAVVTILALSGLLEVSTPAQAHRLAAGSMLVLDPGVPHDVHAPQPSQMLLTVAPTDHQDQGSS
jgi:quercetin dioxygenase-like cupin family protein